MTDLTQGFPKLNAALVDQKTGTVTQPWLQFFISLWNRTGGSAPSGQVSSVNVVSNNGITSSVANPTSTVVITLGLGSITPTSVTASGNIVGANLSGTNTGDVTLAGENYLTLVNQVITAHAINLSSSNATGILAAGRFPALTGDVTTVAGNLATTIANNAVTTAKINNNAVTNAKMANGTNNTLAGYSNTGAFSGVTPGGQLTLSGGTLNTNGITATITTAPLTGGGTSGSMTFTNGILTAQTPAT